MGEAYEQEVNSPYTHTWSLTLATQAEISASFEFDECNNTCAFCLSHFDPEDNRVWRCLTCQHAYHEDCCASWYQDGHSCPHCRSGRTEEVGGV